MPPPEMLLDALLYAVLPALVAAAVVMAALTMLTGADSAPAAAAVGFVIGVGIGCWLRTIHHLVPGDSSWNHLLWAVLGVLCVARLARTPGLPTLDGALLRMIACIGSAWWLIPETDRTEIVWLVPAFAAIFCAEWLLLDLLAAEPPGGAIPFLLGVTFFTASIVLLQASSARLSELALVASSALVGVALVSGFWRLDAGGIVPVAILTLQSALLIGQRETFNESLSVYAFALTAGAPLMLAPSLALRKTGGLGLRMMQLVLVLIPLAVAFALALQAGTPDFGE